MGLRVIVGAGGHAESILDAVSAWEEPARYIILDDNQEIWGTDLNQIMIVGGTILLGDFGKNADNEFIIGIGFPPALRAGFFNQAVALGLTPFNIIHPTAQISKRAMLGQGIAVLAKAIIGPSASIGNNAIINTGANIEHGAIVMSSVHVAPGATVLGGVQIGSETMIGAGAVVLPGVVVGSGAMVGAGAVVLDDVKVGTTVVGVPAVEVK